jgi:single-strand DNA-binding protein
MTTQVAIEGFVGTTPRFARTNGGSAVASFRAAVNHRRLDQDSGQWVTTGTSWYTITAYGVLAEQVAQKVQKGSAVVVAGDLRINNWETEKSSGVTAEITASGIGFNLLFDAQAESDTPLSGLEPVSVGAAPIDSPIEVPLNADFEPPF